MTTNTRHGYEKESFFFFVVVVVDRDMKYLLFFLASLLVFQSSRASVEITIDGENSTIFADLNGAMVLRGIVNTADPTVLVDDYSILASDLITALAPDIPSTRVFKTGINTGALSFHQVAQHSTYQIYSAETDFKLISWHTGRAALVASNVASRSRAMNGKPYRLLAAFTAAQLSHQVIFEDIYDGDAAERATYTTSAYFALLNGAVDSNVSSLVIRHLYNASPSVVQQVASDYKTNLFGTTLVLTLTLSPEHVLLVSKQSGLTCANLESSFTTTATFSCSDA